MLSVVSAINRQIGACIDRKSVKRMHIVYIRFNIIFYGTMQPHLIKSDDHHNKIRIKDKMKVNILIYAAAAAIVVVVVVVVEEKVVV